MTEEDIKERARIAAAMMIYHEPNPTWRFMGKTRPIPFDYGYNKRVVDAFEEIIKETIKNCKGNSNG